MKKNRLKEIAVKHLKKHGVKPIYIVISGAHLYGFPSRDSDYDIRCCHIRDTESMFHLNKPGDIIEFTEVIDGVEIDLVSHEVEKVLRLVLSNNSNMMEHIFTENLQPTIEHKALKKLAQVGLSKAVYKPYQGMAKQNYKKFIEDMNPAYKGKSVKKYLYVLRSYMAGIYALEKGKIEPNINRLNKYFKLPVVNELVKMKMKSPEKGFISSSDKAEKAIAKLAARIELAKEKSKLPDHPQNKDAFDKFLYRIRLKYM